MATNFVCKLCGSPSPPVFALSSAGKIPLCANDIGKFISTQTTAAHTIFPIAAIAFIGSVSDLPLFEQRTEAMNKSDRVIEQWMTAEKDQFQEAVIMLQVLEQNALSVVSAEFQTCIQKLRNLHEAMTAQLAAARTEINQAKCVKNSPFGPVAETIVNLSEEMSAVPAFFSESVHNVEYQISKTAQASLTLPTLDAVQFIMKFFPNKAEEQTTQKQQLALVKKEPVPNVPKPADEPRKVPCDVTKRPVPQTQQEKPGLKLCQTCNIRLTAKNSASLFNHETCFVCFHCIKTKNNIYLLCPYCKSGYSKETKRLLEEKIPDLMATLAENKEKKKLQEAIKCASCLEVCEEPFHQCTGEALCLECYERTIVGNCYGSRPLCPTCLSIPTELYENRDPKKCSECEATLKLNQVAHWCEGEDFLVCAACFPSIVEDGCCRECEEEIDDSPQ